MAYKGYKGCGPRGLGTSPVKQTVTIKPIKKKRDPNTFTKNYNAATGITHDIILDDGGNPVTPGYDPRRAAQYEANAIKKYGSLEASRKAYSNLPPRAGGPSREAYNKAPKSNAKILGAIAGAVAPALIKGAAGALASKAINGKK